jgi:hypothetical protein
VRQTRKVVKDGIHKGQNRGEVEDKRAEKMGELARYARDNGGHGGLQEQVDGFAQYDYKCTLCSAINKGPKQPAFAISLPCRSCGQTTEQERHRL